LQRENKRLRRSLKQTSAENIKFQAALRAARREQEQRDKQEVFGALPPPPSSFALADKAVLLLIPLTKSPNLRPQNLDPRPTQ